MKTKITELFNIEHPILMTGMSWISVPELVAAVSEAGGLGILATGPLSPDQTRESIRKTRELTSKPFGAGATLLMPRAAENALVLLEEQVPVINFSLGKGDWIVNRAHEYGGKVIATVTTEYHAKAAEGYGCDAVMVTGNAAAAHGSQVCTIVLVPAIARAVNIPVIATGGLCDAKGLLAVLALGAEAMAMGTRFSLTQESPVHQNTNQAVLQKSIDDTIYSDRFDGLCCRVMDTEAARNSVAKGRTLVAGLLASFQVAKSLGEPWGNLLKAIGKRPRRLGDGTSRTTTKAIAPPEKKSRPNPIVRGVKEAMKMGHMAKAYLEIRSATVDGDLEKGVHLIGQVQGLISDMPTAGEVICSIMADADQVYRSISDKVIQQPGSDSETG